MSWDMQRDSLIHQHGAYSQQVQSYDRSLADQRASQAFPSFPQPSGAGAVGGGGSAAGGAEALGALVVGGAVLVLGIAILNQLWLIAQEAWALTGAAAARPELPGSRLVLGGLVLHSAAVLVASAYAARLSGRRHWVFVLFLAVVLWVPALPAFAWLGGVLVGQGGLFAAMGEQIAMRLILFSPPTGGRFPPEAPALAVGAATMLAGLPLAHLALKLADRLLLALARLVLTASAAAGRLRLLWLARGLVAAALALALLAAPKPPLEMPSTLWLHAAILPALLFGARAGAAAAVAGVLAAPWLAAGADLDGTLDALRRPFAVWGVVFVAAGLAAGWLRSARFVTFGRELGTAIGATALALVLGWGAFIAYFSAGPAAAPLAWPGDYMVWWLDWVRESGLAMAASIGIAALAASILRAVGQSFAARAQTAAA